MTTKVYYKAFIDKKVVLRQIDVSTDDHVLALSSVASQLKMDNEFYYKPLLAVIKGGKI